MGCDIHCHIEWKHYQTADGEWVIGGFAQPYFGRNYKLFGLMAGVRWPDVKMFEPRGIPNDICSWTTLDNYTCRVGDGWREDESLYSPENAESWVRSGISEWWVGKCGNQSVRRVTNPDWHHPSYLYAYELVEVAAAYCKDGDRLPETFSAIIGAMEGLNGGDPERSRLVFWFDN